MAAHQLYPTPTTQMHELGRLARARGLDFETWWLEAIRPGRTPIISTTPVEKRPEGCVVWSSDSAESRSWRDAIRDTKDAWGRSYDGMDPTAADRAVVSLAHALSSADLELRTVAA